MVALADCCALAGPLVALERSLDASPALLPLNQIGIFGLGLTCPRCFSAAFDS